MAVRGYRGCFWGTRDTKRRAEESFEVVDLRLSHKQRLRARCRVVDLAACGVAGVVQINTELGGFCSRMSGNPKLADSRAGLDRYWQDS